MRRFLQRFPSLLTRNFLHSPGNLRHSNTNSRVVVPLFNRAISRSVFFSSESDSARGSKSDDVVSKEELKKRIQRFLDDGDEDSLPDLFEVMMLRKLSGKHDDSDNEVMDEVRKYPVNDARKVDDDTDSDNESDGYGDSDIESDDLRDGDSSDSDFESDGLTDGDSSDSDFESDDLRDRNLSDSDIESDGLGLRDGDSSDSDIEFYGLKDVGLSDVNIKIGGLKANNSSYSDTK